MGCTDAVFMGCIERVYWGVLKEWHHLWRTYLTPVCWFPSLGWPQVPWLAWLATYPPSCQNPPEKRERGEECLIGYRWVREIVDEWVVRQNNWMNDRVGRVGEGREHYLASVGSEGIKEWLVQQLYHIIGVLFSHLSASKTRPWEMSVKIDQSKSIRMNVWGNKIRSVSAVSYKSSSTRKIALVMITLVMVTLVMGNVQNE